MLRRTLPWLVIFDGVIAIVALLVLMTCLALARRRYKR